MFSLIASSLCPSPTPVYYQWMTLKLGKAFLDSFTLFPPRPISVLSPRLPPRLHYPVSLSPVLSLYQMVTHHSLSMAHLSLTPKHWHTSLLHGVILSLILINKLNINILLISMLLLILSMPLTIIWILIFVNWVAMLNAALLLGFLLAWLARLQDLVPLQHCADKGPHCQCHCQWRSPSSLRCIAPGLPKEPPSSGKKVKRPRAEGLSGSSETSAPMTYQTSAQPNVPSPNKKSVTRKSMAVCLLSIYMVLLDYVVWHAFYFHVAVQTWGFW